MSGPGLRVAIKDLIDVAGLPTTAGSRAIAEQARPAAADAPCLAGLRAAMARGEACLAGKTNLHELAYGISGINAAFGTPVNPLDPLRVPGGSSSGSAVAVASGEADISYGSDTGGSIRIPAACCGIAGLKTTWGRIPLTGVWPLAPSMDTLGPMARDVAGLIAGMQLLEPGFSVAAPAPRVVGRVVIGADPVIDHAVDAALAATGWEVVQVGLDGLDRATVAAMTVLDAEAWASDGGYAEAAPDKIGRDVLARLRAGEHHHPGGSSARPGRRRRAGAPPCRRSGSGLTCSRSRRLLGFPPTLDKSREMVRIRGLTSPVNLAGRAGARAARAHRRPASRERPADRAAPGARRACSPRAPSSSRPCVGLGLRRLPRADRPADSADDRVAGRADHGALGQRQVEAGTAGGGPSRAAARWPPRPGPRTAPGRPAAAAGSAAGTGPPRGPRRCRAVPPGTG